MRKNQAAGKTHFYYLSPFYYCIQQIHLSAKYVPRAILGSYNTSRNERGNTPCPRGADLSFLLSSKGLQLYRCLSMTRKCLCNGMKPALGNSKACDGLERNRETGVCFPIRDTLLSQLLKKIE